MKLLLAASTTDLNALRYPVLASPKLDGVRAVIKPDGVFSRTGKLIPNEFVQRELTKPEFVDLDGELIVGPDNHSTCFSVTQSGVMTIKGEPNFRFFAFDRVSDKLFSDRLQTIPTIGRVQKLHHEFIADADTLAHYEEQAVAQGYEGIMVRSEFGIYKHGRSSLREQILVKVKRFDDAEAEILDLKPLVRITGEVDHTLMGKLHVRAINGRFAGQKFSIGSGFNLDDRIAMMAAPPIGKILTFKFQDVGSVEKPRFPIFKSIRKDV